MATDDLPAYPPEQRSWVCEGIGGLLSTIGSYDRATHWYRRALTLHDDVAPRAEAWLGLIACLHDAGRDADAGSAIDEARAALGPNLAPYVLQFATEEAYQLAVSGRASRARGELQRVLDRASDGDGYRSARVRVRAHTLSARIALAVGDPLGAATHLVSADQLAKAISDYPGYRTTILGTLARAYDQLGRTSDAAEVRRTAAGWPATIRKRSAELSASIPPERLRPPRTPFGFDVLLGVTVTVIVVLAAAVALR
jgi:tetratricopeptide (TPR) repeat protein